MSALDKKLIPNYTWTINLSVYTLSIITAVFVFLGVSDKTDPVFKETSPLLVSNAHSTLVIDKTDVV